MDEQEHERKAEDQEEKEEGRDLGKKGKNGFGEPAPQTYIFQCVQKTSVPKCNIN